LIPRLSLAKWTLQTYIIRLTTQHTEVPFRCCCHSKILPALSCGIDRKTWLVRQGIYLPAIEHFHERDLAVTNVSGTITQHRPDSRRDLHFEHRLGHNLNDQGHEASLQLLRMSNYLLDTSPTSALLLQAISTREYPPRFSLRKSGTNLRQISFNT